MSFRRRALFLAGLFVAVSCSDAGNPLEPGPKPKPDPVDALQALECTLNVPSATLRCAVPQPAAGNAMGSGPLITGGQNIYVTLTASNFAPTANSLEMDVTVQNLMRQPLGTADGTTLHPNGVRVWFYQTPAGEPTGTVTVDSMTNSGIGIGDGVQPYFQYDEVLEMNETSAPKRWRFDYTGAVTNIHFYVYVEAEVQYPNGWVEVAPKVDTLQPGETVDLNGVAYDKRADAGPAVSQTLTWNSSNSDIASVDAGTGLVTADSAGTVTITATNGTQSGTATIVVNSQPAFVVDSILAITNVTIPEPAPGLLQGASDGDGHTLSVVADTVTTVRGGTAWLNADGSLEYLSKAGFAGRDTIPFELSDGVSKRPAYAIVDVAPSNYWYVRAGGTGDGRDRFPLGTLAQAQDSAAAGDSILVLTNGVTPLNGPVTLDANQAILGGGIPASITREVNGQTVTILAGGGSAPGLTNTAAGATITLGADNVIRGVGIQATSGAAIAGNGFGTLTAGDLSASATGPVLSLTNGALSAVFSTLSSTGSAGSGLSLANVTGSLTSTGGAISGAASASVNLSGGSVSVTYGGNVTQGNSAALLAVSGNHTGTLAFNGTLSATAGTGLQFNDADGTYNFNGTTTLNGGDAGVDIGNGSAGTFAFASGTAITSPSGTAFAVNGSSPTVTYNGKITQANNALLVDVSEQAGGSVTFQTDTLSATGGTGILLSNADGAVSFNGTTTLNGAGTAVNVIADATGTLTFGAGSSVTHSTGTGLNVLNSAPTVAFGGSITSSGTGAPVVVDAASPCGTVSVSGNISSTGQGIRVQDCSAGTVSFTGTKTLNTGANAGVTVSNNTGTAAVNLTGGALSITTTAAAGIVGNGAGGFGALTVNNASVNATGGPALNLNNGSLNGTFSLLTSAGSTGTGVNLATVNGTLNASDGSISGAAGTAFAVSGGNVGGTIASVIRQATASQALIAIAGGHNTGTLTFADSVVATNGIGLQFTDADGTYTFTGHFNLDGTGDEGIDIAAASSGTINVTPSGGNTAAITSPSGIAIAIAGGSADLNYTGNVTQASNAPLLSVAGGHTGDVAFPSGTLNASNGNGLQFDNADGTYDFDGTVTLVGGDAGIDVTNGSGGTFTFPQTANITSPSTGNLISILNSAPNFTYSGGLTKANNNVTGILVSSNTGGTITFNGDATSADGDPADVARTISSGTAAAVNLSNNGGATININGGGLNITTTSGAGFTATGGGTVAITGAGNTVSSTGGGTAVNVQNTTIAGSGLSFVSLNATGGGANGIVLTNTGAGGLQVTGDGASDLANTTRGRTTARSGGGSIALGSGGSISGKSGDGVNLSSTGAVILRNLVVSGGGGDGIDASSVSGGLVLDNLQVTGHANNRGVSVASTNGLKIFHSEISNNATTAAAGAATLYNLQLNDVTGTDSIMSTLLQNSYGFVARVANNSGTLNLRVENSTVTGATNGIAFGLYPEGTSNVTANFQNDSIGHSSARGLQAATGTSSSATLNLTVNGTAFRNNFVGLDAAHGSSGTYTFSITNNNLQTNVASSAMAINVNRLGSPSFNAFGLFTGTISGNTIGTAGTANSGSDTGSGIEVESNGSGGNLRVAVVNNTIRQVATHGIYVAAVDANIGGSAAPTVEARIQGNSVANLEGVALDGIHVLPGALSTDDVVMCLDIVGNNSTGIRNGLRVRPSGLPAAPSVIQLEGWDGATARATYFASRPNTLAGGTAAYAEGTPSAPGGFTAVANCNTP